MNPTREREQERHTVDTEREGKRCDRDMERNRDAQGERESERYRE